MGVARRWTHEEDRAIRRLFPEHGGVWPGWADVLPGRHVEAIYRRAQTLGVRSRHRGRHPKGKEPRVRPATCGACRHYQGDPAGAGRCAERHARAWFGGCPSVLACYDAATCEHGEVAP